MDKHCSTDCDFPNCTLQGCIYKIGSQPIRTLCLYQPFATLMLPPYDKVETRWVISGKKPPFPLGSYMIYSAKLKTHMDYFMGIAGRFAMPALSRIQNDKTLGLYGYALMLSELYAVEKMTFEMGELAFVDVKYLEAEDPDSDKVYTLWALKFRNRRRIKPFPFKGKQGIGFLKEEFKRQIQFL